MLKKLLVIILSAMLCISALAFSACSSVITNGEVDQINDPATVNEIGEESKKVEERKDYSEEGITYNEAGGFYEKEVEDVIKVSYLPYVSSMYFYEIDFDSIDTADTFIISVVYGQLAVLGDSTQTGKMVTLRSGEAVRWGYDESERIEEVQNKPIYIDVIVKKLGEIVGYGVIKISDEGDIQNSIKVEKFAYIPQIEGQGQTITEKQVDNAVQSIK